MLKKITLLQILASLAISINVASVYRYFFGILLVFLSTIAYSQNISDSLPAEITKSVSTGVATNDDHSGIALFGDAKLFTQSSTISKVALKKSVKNQAGAKKLIEKGAKTVAQLKKQTIKVVRSSAFTASQSSTNSEIVVFNNKNQLVSSSNNNHYEFAAVNQHYIDHHQFDTLNKILIQRYHVVIKENVSKIHSVRPPPCDFII